MGLQEQGWVQIITFLASSILVIGGWYLVFRYNVKAQKENLKLQTKAKVYENFWLMRGRLQEAGSCLSASIQSGPPFILMNAGLFLYEQKSDIEKLKMLQNSIDQLNDYFENLELLKNQFNDEYLNFWRDLEMWVYIMPDLEVAYKTLMSEYKHVGDVLEEYNTYMVTLDRYKWKEWDKEDIKRRSSYVWQILIDLGIYTEDFMCLVQNELVAPIFGHYNKSRVPNDPSCKVLTKNGLAVINK